MAAKKKRRLIKRLPQTGRTTARADRTRRALAPGRRRSSTGRVYTERRRNRSDMPGRRL